MLLSDSVEKLNLVGPIYAKRLSKLGINTIEDLLFHIPFRYDDFSKISLIYGSKIGETLTISGKIEKFENVFSKKGKQIQKAVVSDTSGSIEIIWFNQIYLQKTLKIGSFYNFSGKIEWFGNKIAMISPEFELLNQLGQTIHTGRIVPIYPETYGVSSKWLRSRINVVLKFLGNQIEEFLPAEIINNESLMAERRAIEEIHFPQDFSIIKKALYRLSFDELFLLQLSALLRKSEWEKNITGKKYIIDRPLINNLISSLPYSLTDAQKRCVDEILTDLSSQKPMNRILEGDVGSGKTVVSAISAYAAYLNNYQTLLMAPTEILANQHYSTLNNILAPFGIPIELITGSNKPKKQSTKMSFQKREALSGIYIDSRLRGNDTDNKAIPKVIIGTHALLYQDFDMENIGLVIVDEQHRFGVEQRKLISEKGKAPHFLTMTATPIPRTIALTVFGDLDLSIIDEMPTGRISVKTWVVPKEKREDAYRWIYSRINKTPEQAFIVCPFIEESENMKTIKAAKIEFEKLSKEIFPNLKLALLHGKTKSREKNLILNEFKNGKYDILIATPVVEVGIDVPNATIMMIEGADRFGLAQLHQLRGRVGRSNLQSYCLLFTENQNPPVLERLKSLEKTNIGMELAEIDLASRGPGEIYGTKQHGFFNLKVASYTDIELIKKTRKYAQVILNSQLDNSSIGELTNSPLKHRLEKYKISTVNN